MNKFAIILVLIYNLFFNTAIASALPANNTDLSEEVLFIPNTSKPEIKYSKPVDKKSDTLTLKQNKEELLKQMELFEDAFKKLKRCIEEEKKDEIREIMRLSTYQRKLFDKGE